MKKVLKILLVIILIGTSIGVIIVGKGYSMYKEAIEEVPIEEKVDKIRQKEGYTKISELPQTYLEAVISVEDHRFYKHPGIDIISIGRAIINDIKAMEFIEGGSTITQQIAKNEYFSQEKKLSRKVAEVFMAFEIEKKYSKDEILELYVNTIYFGNGYYNIKDACKGYFGKTLNNMTKGECIMLAGIPNAPSVYNPKENLKLAKQRQKQVAGKMVEYGYLTEEEANEILNALKQLTESSDNKQRYIILRKIGCDEKMINQALFRQIAIFFMLPLLLAIIHSIFGIQFVMSMMSVLASAEELLPSIIVTVIIIGIIYGAYFAATYFVSKNIIKEEE